MSSARSMFLGQVERAALAADMPAILSALQRAPAVAQAAAAGAQARGLQPPVRAHALAAEAAALAARRLAQQSKPAHAQAFLELCMERGLLNERQAAAAAVEVLRAYYAAGDLQGVRPRQRERRALT